MAEIARSSAPIEWIVIDASPVNDIDITAVHKLKDLREELAGRGIELKYARVKNSLWKHFYSHWVADNLQLNKTSRFASLASAIEAFEQRELRSAK